MQADTIIHGETYDLSVSAEDIDGSITLDGTWQVAARITKRKIGGPTFLDPVMVIAGGVATTSIDTGDSPWEPGLYVYDIRLTSPEGDDYWSEPVRLVLEPRNTPES